MKKKKVAVVIPIYNPPTHWKESCLEHMVAMQTLHPEYQLRFVLVNDGSAKKIFQPLQINLKSANVDYSFLHLSKNFGKGKAIRTGVGSVLKWAECIVCVDWDFPFGVSVIGKMVQHVFQGSDIVLADRGSHYVQQLPKMRDLITQSWRTFFQKVLHLKLPDTQAGVKAFSKKGAKVLADCTVNSFLLDFEFLLRAKEVGLHISTEKVLLSGGVKLHTFPIRTYIHECLVLVDLLKRYFIRSTDNSTGFRSKPQYALHVDDFGYNKETNQAIKKAILAKRVTSVSVMVNMPYFEDAVQFLRNHPEVNVGLHFNITEGMTAELFHSSLLGIIFGRIPHSLLQSELETQYEMLRKTNLPITRLDSHQHLHAWPPVYSLFLKFANKHNITQLRGSSFSLFTFLSFILLRPTLKQAIIVLAYCINHLLHKSESALTTTGLFDLNWHTPLRIRKVHKLLRNLQDKTELFCHLSDKVTQNPFSKNRFACYQYILSPGFRKLFR